MQWRSSDAASYRACIIEITVECSEASPAHWIRGLARHR